MKMLAILYVRVLWTKTKISSYKCVFYDALPSYARISDDKGSIMCNSERRTIRTPVVKGLHVCCMNSKVEITNRHPRDTGTGVWNVNSFHVC